MWHLDPFIEASPYIGGWLLHLRETRSTNDLALNTPELLKKSGLVIVADTQSRGRGRKDREWFSSIYGNLYTTFILHECFSPPVLPYITLLIGLAVYDTLTGLGLDHVSIKWPNDCLIAGKKVAGVLVESKDLEEGVHAMVIGVGINITGRVGAFPEDLRQRATTIEEVLGVVINRLHLLKSLVRATNDVLTDYGRYGPERLLDRWMSSSSSIGRRVLVTDGSDRVIGVVVGLSKRGFLLLRLDDGRIIEIISGDVEFI